VATIAVDAYPFQSVTVSARATEGAIIPQSAATARNPATTEVVSVERIGAMLLLLEDRTGPTLRSVGCRAVRFGFLR
jgi:hypothetical protein